jgi:hypothetical protein
MATSPRSPVRSPPRRPRRRSADRARAARALLRDIETREPYVEKMVTDVLTEALAGDPDVEPPLPKKRR